MLQVLIVMYSDVVVSAAVVVDVLWVGCESYCSPLKADGSFFSVCVIRGSAVIGPEGVSSGSEHAAFPEHNFDNVIKVGLIPPMTRTGFLRKFTSGFCHGYTVGSLMEHHV